MRFRWAVFCLSTMLLGNFPPGTLKDVSVKMWNGPLDSNRPYPFLIDVIGVIEDYHALSSTLRLQQPKNTFLKKNFKEQVKRILAIADEVMEIEVLDDREVGCRSSVRTIFGADEVISYVCIIVPPHSTMMEKMLDLSVGTTVEVKCQLGFKEKDSSLILVGENIAEVLDVSLIVNTA